MQRVVFEDSFLTPSKVVCVGRNYVEHIKELNNEMPEEMVIFNKPNSAISSKLYFFEDCRFEGEISFLIVDKKIQGVGFGFDLTLESIQNRLKSKGLPWERAKAFDKSAVFSRFVKCNEDLSNLQMKLYKNGDLVQFADIDLMIYKPNEIIKEVSSFMTLEDGDIIMSGTPKGVGRYQRGDKFEANIYQNDKLILKESFVAL